MTRTKKPKLMFSPYTHRVYIVTTYENCGGHNFIATTKFDITDEFRRICKLNPPLPKTAKRKIKEENKMTPEEKKCSMKNMLEMHKSESDLGYCTACNWNVNILINEALSAQAKQIFEEIASSSKIGEVRDEESTIIFQTFTIRWDAWQNLKAKWCK